VRELHLKPLCWSFLRLAATTATALLLRAGGHAGAVELQQSLRFFAQAALMFFSLIPFVHTTRPRPRPRAPQPQLRLRPPPLCPQCLCVCLPARACVCARVS
jgi:hypothetical protein